MKESVLITGGSGFVAGHLIKALDGVCEVFVHTRKITEKIAANAFGSITMLEGAFDSEAIAERIGTDVGVVFHLAGAVTVKNALELFNANMVSTSNVIDLMEKAEIPHLIFLSTAAVWSGSSEQVLDENVSEEPNTPYGYAKLAAEALIFDAVRQKKLRSATILRCNNTYGPGSVQGVVANFYEKLKSGKPVEIDGDGSQLREPLFIDDLVDLILLAKDRHVDGVQIFGVSGPEAMTVRELAAKVAEGIGCELCIRSTSERNDRSRHLVVSTRKAFIELGWQPATNIGDGVRQMIHIERCHSEG